MFYFVNGGHRLEIATFFKKLWIFKNDILGSPTSEEHIHKVSFASDA